MYAFTALYLYKTVFTIELLAAEFLMCIGMKRRPYFALRIIGAVAISIGLSFAIPILAYNALYCSVMFLLIFGISLLGIKLCYDERWMTVVFRGIAAYTTQHIAYEIFDLASIGIGAMFGGGSSPGGAYGDGAATSFIPVLVNALRNPTASSGGSAFDMLQTICTYCAYFFIYIATYYIVYSFASAQLKDSDKFELKNSTKFVLIACFVVFNVVVSSVVTYYGGPNFDVAYAVILVLYNIACSFFTMYIMFAVIYRTQLEREFVAANRLLRRSEEQYALAKRNVELINLKCHDLKHQIRTVSSSSDTDRGSIKEIEDLIAIYDASISTGNEALDIILTEKSLYCNQSGIKLYCIVDGALLDFMTAPDLYSLFGNIMDNAIEAVEKLDADKRFINLSLRKVNDFIRVSESNCMPAPIEFTDGLPKTTKPDKELHGYGMKSISLICKKYNGELLLSTDNGVFELSLVFMK